MESIKEPSAPVQLNTQEEPIAPVLSNTRLCTQEEPIAPVLSNTRLCTQEEPHINSSKLYFKITSANENHNGFQYVDGLNILNCPFQEKGSCVPGGLYFSDAKNILKFLEYGIYLREITLPESDPDFKMVLDPEGNKWRANKIILGRRYNLSDVSTFEYLLSLGANFPFVKINSHYRRQKSSEKVYDDDRTNYSSLFIMQFDLIKWVCRHGYLEILKYFIDQGFDIKYHDGISIRTASEYGHIDLVKFLVKNGVNYRIDQDISIKLASANGHLETVKFLIEKGANCCADDNYPIRWASYYGHLEVVKYLIEKGADPTSQNNSAFNCAQENWHTEVAEFLKSQIKIE